MTTTDNDPDAPAAEGPPRFSEAKRVALEKFEIDYFMRLSEAAAGNVSAMARISGLERANVRAYLQRHGIGRDARPARPVGARKTIALLHDILRPAEGETIVQAAARLAGEAAGRGKRGAR